MKKSRIIIPALGLIALGTAASITGTVAWFSMNTKVTVTGMTVHTEVSSNLQIAEDTLANGTRVADSNFTSKIDTSLTALLEPVSTVNGKNFFYTVNGKANGDAAADDYVAYNAAEIPTSGDASKEIEKFNAAYGTSGAVGYKDYVFELKAANTVAASKDIKITRLDMIYAGAKDASKAYRVAVLVEDLGEAGSNPANAGQSGTLKGIYAPDGGNNQTANYAVSAAGTAPTALASPYNTVSVIGSVPANKTNYYKVVLRLYLEGEDTTCTTATFLNLTSTWDLKIEIALDTASTTNTAVSALGKYTTYTTTADTKTYVCDGTNVFLADANGDPTGSAVTSAGLANATLESELEGAFGVSID